MYLKPLCCIPIGGGVHGVIWSFTLVAVAVTGDFGVTVLHYNFARALCDNITHGAIGFFSWFIVASGSNLKLRATESLICAFFASAIDVDHFIAARSLNIKDAGNLLSRPFMHCTTLVILVSLFIRAVMKAIQLTYVLPATLKRIDWLFFMASISHHIRDGNRRGLWLWPLPFWSSGNTYSTPPISKVLYLICTVALPQLLKYVITADAEGPSHRTENILIV